MMSSPRPALAGLALVLAVLLAGCNLIEEAGPGPAAAQATASPTAAATPAAATATPALPTASPTAPPASPTAVTAAPKALQVSGAESLTTAVRRVADMRKPAVVLIANLGAAAGPSLSPVPTEQGIGSGAIIDADGHIVTNNHVVEGAQALRVVLPDGRTFDGRLVGRDPRTDLAVVKIDGANLPVAPLAPRVNVVVGDWVVAIGNALGLPGGPTVTAGVVGALGRTVEEPNGVSLQDMIQTDAAINPGNSGGPLLNLNGEIIGINTAGIQGAEGLGFAISVDTVHEVVPQLIQNGRVIRPFMGVSVAAVTPGLAARFNLPREDGLLVVQVGAGTPAAQAGLQEGDILLAANGTQLRSEADLRRLLAQHQPGDTLTLTVQRGQQQQQVRLTLGETPSP